MLFGEDIMKNFSKNIWRMINILFFLVFSSLFGWIVWKTYQADNLGFNNKTLWDWMELLVVPAILALLAYFLNKSQKDTELKIAEIRRIEERESAEKRANVDRGIEKDRQQQKALVDYLDRMTDLLLNNKLRRSLPSDEIRSIARTRTLTILQGLDGLRKSQLIQFLYESSLIGKINEEKMIEAIIDLSFANLQNIELKYGNLDGVNFSKTNLRNTDFEMANLIGANFFHADLDGSDFSWTNLTGSSLRAGLKRVNLASANLEKADLGGANLCGAKLWHTSLKGANLQNANFLFENHYLRNEDNLSPATLMNVDLSGADLRNAIISPKQLLGVRSLSNAILPNGQKFEVWKEKCNLKHGEVFYAADLYEIKDLIGLTDIDNNTYYPKFSPSDFEGAERQ